METQAHPVVERWKAQPVEVAAETEAPTEGKEVPAGAPMFELSTLPITAGGFKIILKDAKIHAKRVIIRAERAEKKR